MTAVPVRRPDDHNLSTAGPRMAISMPGAPGVRRLDLARGKAVLAKLWSFGAGDRQRSVTLVTGTMPRAPPLRRRGRALSQAEP